MTATAPTFNEDFITFQGDDVSPIFTVVDADGVAVNISAVTAITWACRKTADDAAALSLSLAGGAIALVGGGTSGQFQVSISAAQTTALDQGWYQHYATITLAGKVNTVIVGRMQVGLKPTWTYDAASVATVPLFQVRRLLGDVIQNDQQLQDSEILFALSERGSNIYGAAADCARYIAGQYARKVDTTSPGSIQTAYGTQSKKYSDLAVSLDQKSRARGAGVSMSYAGGISVTDKVNVQNDSDRVQPSFNIGMMDNSLPVGQVGNETPTLPQSGSVPS